MMSGAGHGVLGLGSSVAPPFALLKALMPISLVVGVVILDWAFSFMAMAHTAPVVLLFARSDYK